MSSLSLEAFKPKVDTPTPPPAAEGIPALGWGWGGYFGPIRMLLQDPRATAHSFIHSTHIHQGLLCQARDNRHWGWVGQNQRSLLSESSPPPSREREAGAGQGTEGGGPGCPRSMSQVWLLPSKGPSSFIFQGTGPRTGQGQTQCNLLLRPTPPEVPEALGSFPNEVPGRTLPN